MADSPRLEELRRRVQADPASIAFAALAEEYRRAQQPAEAIETARAGLARHPSYVTARVTLGRALLETGAVDEARRELEQALASAPENLAAIRCLTELHWRQGNVERARELARRGTVLAPADHEFRRLADAIAQPAEPTPRVEGPPPASPSSPPAALAVDASALAVRFADPAVPRLERWLDALDRARARRAGEPVGHAG